MQFLNTFVIGLLLSGASFAGEGKHRAHFEEMKKELNLSDDQVKKSKDIRKEHKEEVRLAKEKFKAAKKDFFESMKNTAAKKEDLQSKFDSFQSARDDFQRKRFNMMLEMRSILNADQITKFHEFKARRWDNKKGRKS